MKKLTNLLNPNAKMAVALLAFFGLLLSCSSDDDKKSNDDPILVGQEGNPRFNLQFTNGDKVDLDLHVETPGGVEIYYGNTSGDSGELDVDCLCSSCPQGPNENIFWESGSAPTGTYKYWIEYFGDCDDQNLSSDYTLRVVRNGEILVTKTGTLSSGETEIWTHTQN